MGMNNFVNDSLFWFSAPLFYIICTISDYLVKLKIIQPQDSLMKKGSTKLYNAPVNE